MKEFGARWKERKDGSMAMVWKRRKVKKYRAEQTRKAGPPQPLGRMPSHGPSTQ